MKIILLQDITKLGKRGTVADVPDVYALNVFIKKGQAIQATPGELAKWKQQEESKKYKKEIVTNTFLQLLDTLHKEKLVITGKKADTKGQLFAQVKESDVVDAIFTATRFSIDAKQVTLPNQIKSLGAHFVILKQGEQKKTIPIIIQ